MTPKKAKEVLIKSVNAQLQVLMVGPPGCGKTDLAHQVAQETESDLVVFHPVVSDPTDFKGLPGFHNGKAEFLPYGDLRSLIEAKWRTICMFDDVGQAPQAVQAALMQLIWSRRVNGHTVSPEVVFMAATNRREDKAGVTGMLEPLKSRWHNILKVDVSVDDWCEWAVQNDVPPELVGFIRFRPDLLLSEAPPTLDIVNRASPRTVTNLGKVFSAGMEDHETLSGPAGEGFATEFIAFLKTYRDLPTVEEVLSSPETARVPTQAASCFAIATAIGYHANKNNVGKAIRYLTRLREEYAVLGIKDMVRRDKEIVRNKDFVAFAVKNQALFT